MTFFILFIMAVQFQSVTVPVSDSVRELGIYISISPDELKSVFIDSVFVSRYEIQVQAYDKPGNQVAGDYWDRVVVLDSIDIQDTVTLVIPMTAVKFNLRIVDLHAY